MESPTRARAALPLVAVAAMRGVSGAGCSLLRTLARRPVLSSRGAEALVAAWLAFAGNTAFWAGTLRATGGVFARPVLLAVVALLLLLLCAMLAALLDSRWSFKPLAGTLLLTSAVVDYFVRADGIRIDATMLQSVVETDLHEALELVTPALLLHVLVLGLLPLAVLARIRIRYGSPGRELLGRLGVVAGGLLGIGLVALVSYKDLVAFGRVHEALRYRVTPFNYSIVLLHRALDRDFREPARVEALGTDARIAAAAAGRERRKLLILVVGETARAASFSLNGYERETNPRLAVENVTSFTRFYSCGTATAVSLPCMFSALPRRSYTDRAARAQEGLLDVLDHAGVAVTWRDNNSGCKRTCDRVEQERVSGEACSGKECYDEALLDGLDDRLTGAEADTVIVLHQKGSHGPAYHRRYPAAFGRFQPACESSDLQGCARQDIVNAYDNTILYTDSVLAEAIALLRRQAARAATALVYVSDHGESLGESGLYLHGLPYSIAPDVQKHVPFIVWFSPEWAADTGLDPACVAARRDLPLGHENLFHTMLGLMEVETSVYDPALDPFAPCRRVRRAATASIIAWPTSAIDGRLPGRHRLRGGRPRQNPRGSRRSAARPEAPRPRPGGVPVLLRLALPAAAALRDDPAGRRPDGRRGGRAGRALPGRQQAGHVPGRGDAVQLAMHVLPARDLGARRAREQRSRGGPGRGGAPGTGRGGPRHGRRPADRARAGRVPAPGARHPGRTSLALRRRAGMEVHRGDAREGDRRVPRCRGEGGGVDADPRPAGLPRGLRERARRRPDEADLAGDGLGGPSMRTAR